MRRSRIEEIPAQGGFSILEMLIATVILLVGLVAVAQLVPASILLNWRSRNDSASTVFAQHELDQMLDQPLLLSTFNDALGNTCLLGNPAATNPQGSPLVVVNNQPLIDFAAATVPGYSFTVPDPTDPTGITQYDVRWAVIITGNGTTASSKRFILGVRQESGSGFSQPVTLDSMVEK